MLRGKRILVTGGLGFLGQHVATRLSRQNSVTVFDKASHKNRDGIQYIRGNVATRKGLSAVNGSFDGIFHFASPPSVVLFNRNPFRYSTETIGGFVNTMEFAKENQVDFVVYPSSGTVYGSRTSAESGIRFPQNYYGVMKDASEKIACLYSDSFRTIGLRIFMGYGPGEERKGSIASPIHLFLSRMMADQRPVVWGNGSQSRDLIYIDDVVSVILRASEIDSPYQVFDVGSGTPVSFNKIIATINEVLGTAIAPEYVPSPKTYIDSTRADPTMTRNLLGHPPVRMEDGIRRFYAYLKSLSNRP